MSTIFTRVSAALGLVLLTGVLLTACQPGDSEKTAADGAEQTAAVASDLTYTATLTYVKYPARGKSSKEVVVLCSDQPISQKFYDQRTDLNLDLEFQAGSQSFTGFLANQSVTGPMSKFDMRKVQLVIKVSNGQEFTWQPDGGKLDSLAKVDFEIKAPGLLKK